MPLVRKQRYVDVAALLSSVLAYLRGTALISRLIPPSLPSALNANLHVCVGSPVNAGHISCCGLDDCDPRKLEPWCCLECKACEQCGNVSEDYILCDECDRAWHGGCLNPPIQYVPEEGECQPSTGFQAHRKHESKALLFTSSFPLSTMRWHVGRAHILDITRHNT